MNCKTMSLGILRYSVYRSCAIGIMAKDEDDE